MSKESQIKQLVREVAGTDVDQVAFRVLEVEEVSDKGNLCTAKRGELSIPGIRLSSVKGGADKGVYIKPAVGSWLVAADFSMGQLREMVAVAYSEVEKITLQGGENGGLVIAQGVVDRLNNIEKDIADLKQAFSKWSLLPPPPQPDSGAALKGIIQTWASTPLIETQLSDIENENIEH